MKKILFLLLLVSAVFLSSCLTIYEKYTINKDGSGSFEYTIDMTELYRMMESFASEEDIGNMNEKDLSRSFYELIPELNTIVGISNAEPTGTDQVYVFGLKFDFENQEALNRAMGMVLEDQGDQTTNFVEISRKKFIRYHKTSREFSKEALLGEEGIGDESMVKGILEDMKYKIDVNFERKVKSVQTKADVVKKEGKEISIEANLNSMMEDSEYLKFVVKTK